MPLSRATLLGTVFLLQFADGAFVNKTFEAAPNVQGLSDEVEGNERHDTKRVARTLVGVMGVNRALDNAMGSVIGASPASMAEHVAERLDNFVGPVATSFARDNVKRVEIGANANKFSLKNIDAAETLKGWLNDMIHPDTIYRLLPIKVGNFGVIDPSAVYAWIWYIDKYMEKVTQKLTTPISSIDEFFSLYSKQVVILIAEAAKKPKLSASLDAIKRLEAYLMCYWFNNYKTTNDVVALLNKFETNNIDVKFLGAIYMKYFDSVSSPKDLEKLIEEFKMKWRTESSGLLPTAITKDNAQLVDQANKYDNTVITAFDKYVHGYNSAKPLETLNLLCVLIACFGEAVASSIISAAKVVPQTVSKAKDLETELIEHWIAMGKTPEEVVKLIDIKTQSVQPISTLLQFSDVYSKRNSVPLENLIVTLKKYYHDEQLIRIVMIEPKSPEAEELKNLLFLDWFNTLKSDDEVLKLFRRLGDGPNTATRDACYDSFKKFRQNLTIELSKRVPTAAGSDDSTMLFAYESLISEHNKEYPNKQLKLLAVLTARFGDSKLAAMIDSSKLDLKHLDLITRLEEEQIQLWVSAGRSPEEIFSLLHPGLQTRQFIAKWLKFSDEFVKRRPELWFDSIEMLRTRYNDNILASIVAEELRSAHSGSRLSDLLFLDFFDRMMTPEKLSTLLNPVNKESTNFDLFVEKYRHFVDNIGPPEALERIKKWCNAKHVTPTAVKQPIAGAGDKVGKQDMFLYDGKVFAAYNSYVRIYNKEKPLARLRLLAALTTRFGDRDASTMILAAKMHSNTVKLAKSLEAGQLEYWVKAGRTPDQVFELMDLDFQSLPSINKWLRFIEQFCHVYQECLINPIVTLNKRYTFSELVKLIAQGRNSDDVERLKDLVIHDLFNSMQSHGKVLEQLSNRGQTDNGESLYNSFKLFRKKMNGLPNLKMLQGDHGFDLLDTKTISLLESKNSAHDGHLVDAYDTYVRVYNKQNPTKRLSLLAVLTARFGEHEVLAMIESAKSNKVAVETAIILEEKLIRHLVDDSAQHGGDLVGTLDVLTERLLAGDDGILRVFTWVECIDVFIERHPKHEFNPIELLRKHFNDVTLATLVVTATLEHERNAERVRDMLVLDWFNKMLTFKQLSELLKLDNLESQHNFTPLRKTLINFISEVSPFSPSSQKLIDGWHGKGWISLDAYDLLKSVLTDEKLRDSVIYAYDTYVGLYNKENPTKQLSLLALLTARFKDADLLAMIDKAKSSSATFEVAKRLEAEQIQFWVKRKKDPSTIFKMLDFKSKRLHFIYKWVEFAGIYCKRYPNLSFDSIEHLKAYFSDLELATFLVDALSKNADDATKLEAGLFSHWFKNGMTYEGLEELLGLNEATKQFFNPLLIRFKGYGEHLTTKIKSALPIISGAKDQNYGEVFVKYDNYARLYNINNPGEQLSLFAILSAHYKDEIVLRMIDKAKLIEATQKSAELAEAQQIQFWVDAKKSKAYVIQLLDSYSKRSSSVHKWVEYSDRYNKRYPEASFDPIELLRDHYSNSVLATFIVESTSKNLDVAKRLEGVLFPRWLNMMMNRDQLYALLELNKGMEPSFAPLLDRFDRFVQSFTSPSLLLTLVNKNINYGELFANYDNCARLYNVEKKPAEQVSLFALLFAKFGDVSVSRMVDEAKLVPATRDSAELVETQLFKYWVGTKKTLEQAVRYIFYGSKNLRSISRCAKFFDIYSKHYPISSHFLIKALRKYFSNDELITLVIKATPESLDVAKRLEAMLFLDWFNSVINSGDLFKRLNLDTKKKRVFAPVLKNYDEFYNNLVERLKVRTDDVGDNISTAGLQLVIFSSHVSEMNKKNPTEQLSLFAALTACHSDGEASTMIQAAKLISIAKQTAIKLERKQIQYWLDTGRTPSDVLELLNFKTKVPGSVYEWVDFCGKYSKLHPNLNEDLIWPLRSKYVDELTLTKYIAQGGAQTKFEVEQLQEMMFRHYFNSFETYDDLFTRLESLAKSIKDPFLSAYKKYVNHDDLSLLVKKSMIATTKEEYISIFNGFVNYAKRLNKKNPIHQKSLLALLFHHLNDDTMIKVLEAAKQGKKLSDLEKEFSTVQLMEWLASHRAIESLGIVKCVKAFIRLRFL